MEVGDTLSVVFAAAEMELPRRVVSVFQRLRLEPRLGERRFVSRHEGYLTLWDLAIYDHNLGVVLLIVPMGQAPEPGYEKHWRFRWEEAMGRWVAKAIGLAMIQLER